MSIIALGAVSCHVICGRDDASMTMKANLSGRCFNDCWNALISKTFLLHQGIHRPMQFASECIRPWDTSFVSHFKRILQTINKKPPTSSMMLWRRLSMHIIRQYRVILSECCQVAWHFDNTCFLTFICLLVFRLFAISNRSSSTRV